MATIGGTSSVTSGLTAQQAADQAKAAAQSALQQAAQSIIGGSTGNSSMNVQALVSALVTAKVAGQTATLTARTTAANAQISAFGQLSASLSGLQVALAPLFNGSMLTSFTATTSGTGITASAGNGAVAGTYALDVTQIASAHSLTSSAFDAKSAASLGTGALTIQVGSQSMTINVNASNNSLSGIASAINSANDNPGLKASVINGSNGQHLVLTATATGAANTISVTPNDTSSDALKSLAVKTTPASNTTPDSKSTLTQPGSLWSQTSYALDAQFTVNGAAATSASNNVTGVINGLTLSLTSAAVDTSGKGTSAQTITVAADTATQVSNISSFVTAYNSLVGTVSTLTAFNKGAAAGQQGSTLLGDPLVNNLREALGNIVGGSVASSGVRSTLGALGITLGDNGKLSLDSAKLTSAVQNNPSQVGAVFNLTNGIGKQLNSAIKPYTQTGGLIDSRTNAATANLNDVTSQSKALTTYSNQLTARYNAEFTALNTLMSTTNNNTQYLTALFGGANNSGTFNKSR
ncbi:flagellar filament capping protein FliD [Paraburkholderia ferrariae]|uniref:flagellar filament capping protein FliD n=1 Tax=Paraburkholderia ferrariae TaxID=386056 RepID=UPI0005AB6400|nr:flagellar filament capping protein FliD [Paraburkholderia ferrariae]